MPLYTHQIPPGAGQTIHYALQLPEELDQPVVVTAKLKYRKFDHGYLDFMILHTSLATMSLPIEANRQDEERIAYHGHGRRFSNI